MRLKNESYLAFAYKNLGRLYVLQWRNQEADEYFQKALRIYERLQRNRSLGDTWFAMATLSENLADFSLSEKYISNGCRIAEKSNDEFLKLSCKINLGELQYREGKYMDALATLLDAVKMIGDKDLPFSMSQVYYDLGDVYEALGQNDISLKYFYEALKTAERLNIKYEIARIYSALAWTYKNQSQFKLAHEFLDKSLAIRKEIGNEHGISNAYNVLGVIYLQEKRYKEGIEALEKSLEIRRRIGHREGISACIFNLALIYEEQKDYKKALEYQKQALDLDMAIGNRNNIAISYNGLGSVNIKLRNFRDAAIYLKKAEALAKETKSRTLRMNNNLFWSQYYEGTGNLRKALDYHKAYTQLNDSIYSEISVGKLAEMQALYQIEKKDQEIKLLNQEKQLKENQLELQHSQIRTQYIIIASVIIAFILASVLAYNIFKFNRRIQKANRSIIEQKEEIQAQSEELIEANQTIALINKQLEAKIEDRTSALRQAYKELDTFFYRSSHDFRRPLTTFLGLAEVAKITVKDPHALELFIKVRDTARNLDKMLVKLQSISDVGAQQLVYKEVFVEELYESVCDTFREELEAQQISISLEVNLSEPFYSYPAMVKIILENLIENSIAFSMPSAPFIKVRIYSKNEHVLLEVEDNGQGIEHQYHDKVFEMYFRASERSKGNGLGLYIVKKAVEKLNGYVSFSSRFDHGSIFTVVFPSGNNYVGERS
jgi:signal transduction histidine kinase